MCIAIYGRAFLQRHNESLCYPSCVISPLCMFVCGYNFCFPQIVGVFFCV